MGDALLQKTFTVDFLTKKWVENTEHAAQYYVEDSHKGYKQGRIREGTGGIYETDEYARLFQDRKKYLYQ